MPPVKVRGESGSVSRYGQPVTFYPDGQPEIPNQTPIPGAGAPEAPAGDRSGTGPEFTRVLVRTTFINGVVLVAAVLLAYVFPISDDPTHATFIVIGAALFSGVHLMVVLRGHQRRSRQQSPGAVSGDAQFGPATQLAPPTPIANGDFSFTVEDVFTITGRGTVVTGRVESGELHEGQSVAIRRGGAVLAEVEVTGIEKFRKVGQVAAAGENVGLLLAGIRRDELQRGDVLTR